MLEFRLFRALCAIVLCVILLIAMVHHRSTMIEAKQAVRFNTATSTFKISEAVYEGSQLLADLTAFRYGYESRDALQLQFDVFWSRVVVVLALGEDKRPKLIATAYTLKKFLERNDPVIYSDLDPKHSAFAQMQSELGAHVIALRQAWITEFNETRFDREAGRDKSLTRARHMIELAVVGLLATIVVYLLTELYLSSIAHKRERKLREMATEASRTKSQFIATVSHEIRTPLNGILGMARILSESKLSQEQRDNVRVLSEAGGVLLSTINDVLEFSKIEAGEAQIRSSVFALEDTVELACKLFVEQAQSKGLTLKANLPDPKPPPLLVGDPRRLRQVLHNLVSNALKFTQEGGVTIDVNYCWETERLRISVFDTGPGIKTKDLDQIFEPFGQTQVSANRETGGTGLGLTISRDLCRAMGGDLVASSAPGKGSCFEIDVPMPVAQVEQQGQVDKVEEAPSNFSDLNILVVDDNDTNRLILRKFLGSVDVVPVEAASGHQAVGAARARAFDIVFMDVQMPGMDGLDATRHIRAQQRDRPETRAVIVGVTANVLPQQIESYLDAGMDFVLPKPVSKRQLINILATVAGGKCALSEDPAQVVNG